MFSGGSEALLFMVCFMVSWCFTVVLSAFKPNIDKLLGGAWDDPVELSLLKASTLGTSFDSVPLGNPQSEARLYKSSECSPLMDDKVVPACYWAHQEFLLQELEVLGRSCLLKKTPTWLIFAGPCWSMLGQFPWVFEINSLAMHVKDLANTMKKNIEIPSRQANCNVIIFKVNETRICFRNPQNKTTINDGELCLNKFKKHGVSRRKRKKPRLQDSQSSGPHPADRFKKH